MIATELETMVVDWLEIRKIDFDFHSSLDGERVEFSGLKADFIVPDYGLVLRITDEEEDEQKAIIENMGYTVVDLKEQDLRIDLNTTMLLALTGE